MLKKLLNRRDHFIWPLSSLVVARGIGLLKIFLLARESGPSVLGMVSFGLLFLAIFEGLTDFGIHQSIIQRQKVVSDVEEKNLWRLLFFRGLVLSILMIVISIYIIYCLKISSSILLIISFLPAVRGIIPISYYRLQASGDFRAYSLINTFAYFVDLCIALLFIQIGFGPLGFFVGVLISEISKFIICAYLFPEADRSWGVIDRKSIAEYTNYGKWIWRSSIINLITSQSDKLAAFFAAGNAGLGIYQMAYKIPQGMMLDPSLAIGQYLFPTLSRLKNNRQQAYKLYLIYNFAMSSISMILICIIIFNSKWIILNILGTEWINAQKSMIMLSISMGISVSFISSVSFLRSIGKPELATRASYFQIASLTLLYVMMYDQISIELISLIVAIGTMAHGIAMVYILIRRHFSAAAAIHALFLIVIGGIMLYYWRGK